MTPIKRESKDKKKLVPLADPSRVLMRTLDGTLISVDKRKIKVKIQWGWSLVSKTDREAIVKKSQRAKGQKGS